MSNANEHSQVLTLQEAAAYLRVSKARLASVINGKVNAQFYSFDTQLIRSDVERHGGEAVVTQTESDGEAE